MTLFGTSNKKKLFTAIERRDEAALRKLLNGGVDVNSRNSYGSTPLHKACFYGRLSIVKLLLDRGAELNSTNKEEWTPLHWACEDGHDDIVKELLNRGAEKDPKGGIARQTPLHLACQRRHSVVVQTLLDRGACIEALAVDMRTPLHEACSYGCLNAVKTLLDKGANTEAKTQTSRETPLHFACRRDYFDIVKELLKKGANPNVKNDYGQVPLDLAKKDEVRKLFSEKPSTSKPESKASPFYEELFRKEAKNDDNALLNKMDKLAQLVGDVHEMKLLYTMAMHCERQKALDMKFCKKCIGTGLVKAAETCATEDAIVIYKIILNKARKDNIISDSDFFRFDNRAEVKRMSEAEFIKDMKRAIQINTRRIESLEHHTDEMQNAIHSVMEHIKYRRNVESAIGVVSCIVNAFTLGVGGSLLQAFDKLTSNVVDFGDVAHMKEEIEVLMEHPDGTQEVVTGYVVGGQVEKLKEQFMEGVEMMGGRFIDKDVDKMLSAMTALGRAAALASFVPMAEDSFPVNSRVVVHGVVSAPKLNGKIGYVQSELMNGRLNVLVDGYLKPVSLKVSNLKSFQDSSPVTPSTSDADNNNNNNESETAASLIFPDAALSEEDEEKFLLHCAVKYGDTEEIKKEVGLAKDINVCDSQGRTALDLAALTGQLEVMELISKHGGEFHFRPSPKMKIIAKKRAPQAKQYLEQMHDSVE